MVINEWRPDHLYCPPETDTVSEPVCSMISVLIYNGIALVCQDVFCFAKDKILDNMVLARIIHKLSAAA